MKESPLLSESESVRESTLHTNKESYSKQHNLTLRIYALHKTRE